MSQITLETWAPLFKARKPIGVENWQRLQHVAEKLKGKSVKDITFTSSHPASLGTKYTLGTQTGNLHFLMGYVSPGFHVKPYHWQIIDPYMTDEEASAKEHPSRQELWKQSGLPVEEEGDLEGVPHPSFKQAKTRKQTETNYRQEAVMAKAGYGRYIGIPSLGLVFGVVDKKLYKWDLVRGSFLAATNPKFYQEMEAAKEMEEEVMFTDKSVNEYLFQEASKYVGTFFDRNVYSIVKSYFPSPGTIVSMDDHVGIITNNSIEFFHKDGHRVNTDVFDKSITSIDFSTKGDSHPSIILNFMENYLGISRESLNMEIHKAQNNYKTIVIGEGTKNTEFWDFRNPSNTREVALVDDVLTVVERK